MQNFFLKRARRQSQVDIPAQRIRVAIEIATNLSADFFDTPSVFNGIQYQPKLCDRTFEIVAAGQIVDEHNTALAQRHEQIAQRRIHHADRGLGRRIRLSALSTRRWERRSNASTFWSPNSLPSCQ